nr:MAG TPA: DNA polymerase B [Caudoviricetes sp.]
MQVRVKRKLFNVYGYDVESHNDEESIAKNETSIWLSVFMTAGDKPEDRGIYFYDGESFINHLETVSKDHWEKANGKRKKACTNYLIYVYNLAHEWSFLLPILLKKGFEWKEKFTDEGKQFMSISNKSCASVWEARLNFGKNHGEIIFRDLCKIFPGGLRKIARSFGLPTQKGDLDYTLNRLHGHVVTDEERLYCYKDVEILCEILKVMADKDDKDFWKSCSTASYSMLKMIREGYPNARKPMKAFRNDYPELDPDETAFLRQGVAGGITYAPWRYQFADIKKRIGHIDIHQAHPNSAYRYPYPYGKGHYFVGKPPLGRWMSACRIRVSYSDVRLHSIIRLIGMDMASDYELVVWDFEIPTMMKCYIDLEIEYIDGYAYAFKRLPWRNYYIKNYTKREHAKKIKDDFNIMYYKLLNNASYGKLLERPHAIVYENYIDEEGVTDSIVHKKDKIETNSKYTYLPVGSAIPAHTRVYLIETALKIGWEKVVYFDTDSIFYIKDSDTEAKLKASGLIGNELGQYSHEKDIVRGNFTAPKRYKIIEEGEDGKQEDVVHMAGVNFGDEKPAYDDLDLLTGDYVIQGRRRAKGGTLIVMKHKKLQVVPKYRKIFDSNANKTIM